jgi:GNAT superfamily N-acetyltransferase
VALATEFHAYLRGLGDPMRFHFTAETFRRDGFGERPAFVALVAEAGGGAVGYALIHFGYDTDRSRREAYLNDLFVTEAWRGQGVGKALIIAAAQAARSQHGAQALWWGVYDRNAVAFRFYEKLGATYVDNVRFMSVDIDALLGGGAAR